MKNIVLLVIFFLGIVLLQYVQSKNIDDIINSYLEARGGKDKLNAIRSIYMEGSRAMMGTEIPVRVTIVQDKLARTDFEFDGKTNYTITTPTEGWSYISIQSPNVESITADTLNNIQAKLDIAGALFNYSAKGYKAALEGKEFINGREAYKIKMIAGTGKEVIYFIDKETDLLIQSREMMSAGENDPYEIITNYSDYTLFDGIMFPQTITNPGDGIMSGTTTFYSIVINKIVDESAYKPSISV